MRPTGGQNRKCSQAKASSKNHHGYENKILLMMDSIVWEIQFRCLFCRRGRPTAMWMARTRIMTTKTSKASSTSTETETESMK